jgi:superfamily II DNA/RNA helicase
MKFSELYLTSLKSVKEALTALWCSEAESPSQKAYAQQLKELIGGSLFADESLFPVVQSMELYESVEELDYQAAIKLIGKDLWGKTKAGKHDRHPYLHQFKCWDALLNRNESIVVTTGTGSGKTECFMLPLVRDLLDHPKAEGKAQIQAIFLYPLNALMEDQKSRIQELLADTDLHFAVYNGNLPERRDEDNADEINTELEKYNRIIPTRVEMHRTPPDILLTNPTMLEYMLLRDKDQSLFTPGSLKWIVVDEAHTFTGASASELALLIRRVVNAFNVIPEKDLRFAASSATIGNDDGDDLRRFISDISGIPLSKVAVINGKHQAIPDGLEPDILECRTALQKNDYLRLDQLIPGPGSIVSKLERLDNLCDRGVRAKVHYFYRVPNNGIRIQLDNWADRNNGIFRLLDYSPDNKNATPALELKRCKHCGEFLATAAMSSFDDTYKACADENSDVFSRMAPSLQHQLRIFGVVEKDSSIPGNVFVKITGNRCFTDDNPTEKWSIVANDLFHCPHCGASLISETTISEQESDGVVDDPENTISDRELNVDSFRVSADFISQTLAPSLLSQLSQYQPTDPHKGQQYISFVDSRQAAAQSTFKQNLEVEKEWIYSRIFHKLCADQANRDRFASELEALTEELRSTDPDDPRYDTLAAERRSLKEKVQRPFAYMTWEEIYSYLSDECKAESDAICKQFVNKESDDEMLNGSINEVVKERYVFSIMLEQLSKYPPHSASAETMGLLESYYPSLVKAITPDAFKHFNVLCGRPIADSELDAEWKNLLKIYVDRVARSNEFIFMKLESHLDSDIFNCSNRFGLKKPSRRVARLPLVNKAEGKLPIIHILLAKMMGADSSNIRDTLKQHKDDINKVIEAMWHSLVEETQLLQYSSRINSRNRVYRLGTTKSDAWILDKDSARNREWLKNKFGDQDLLDKILDPEGRQLRFNVAELSFRLPHIVNVCTVFEGKKKHFRPVTTLFCGHGAYYSGDDVCEPIDTETWDTGYPYIKGLDAQTGLPVSESVVLQWAITNRNILFKYGLMDEDGCFRNKILNCLCYPDIFLQAEHTAQVNKAISKASQLLFQNHKINILACSTTMEMGVDLGDLDLVMMSSIPPHPANYKQRAGRSGRNTGSRSACITLCSSDVVGLRVLHDPIGTLISRRISSPNVDPDCPAIVQRHVNAFLFRQSGLFFSGPNTGRSNLSLEIINCFSLYRFMRKTRYTSTGKAIRYTDYWDLRDQKDNEVFPNTSNPLGSESGTRFEAFKDWLINDAKPSSLDFLLRGTSVEGKNCQMIDECRVEWENRREELIEELSQIGGDYEEAYIELKQNPDSEKSSKAHGNCKLDTPYGNKLRWEFYHILRKNLIEYLATHRFTPNANMPVDIVEFNVNSARALNESPWKRQPNNPSYQLRQALSQYAPGNSVVKENRVLKVAGIDFIGKNRNGDKDPLISFYTDGIDVVTGTLKSRLSKSPLVWPTSNKKELQLAQAKSFIPDINEDDSRILDNSPYTHVNALLVGAEMWKIPEDYSHFAALRCSSNSGNAKILYYNEGMGFGYCLCGRCGKMVLEDGPSRGYANIPSEMVCASKQLKDNTVLRGHYAIDRKADDGNPKLCIPNNNKYFRNVILGDLIQTDYCEIRIRENSNWIESRQDFNISLLTTLGLLICKVFTDYLGKDRQSVDFLLMQAGSLCVFDTNPGGSGYSNKLADPHIFNNVVQRIDDFLKTITTKDALLDKFTLRYLNDIDLDRAREWVSAEMKSWKDLPANIMQTGLDCKWATLSDIIKSMNVSTHQFSLFVNDNWEEWNYRIENQYYDDEEDTWRVRVESLRKEAVRKSIVTNTIVISNGRGNLPAKLYDTAIEIKGWLNGNIKIAKNTLPEGLFPLAMVGDRLFFTDDESFTEVSSKWARGNIFVADRTDLKPFICEDLDLTHRPGTHAEFKLPMDSNYIDHGQTYDLTRIRSNGLFKIVDMFSKNQGIDIAAFLKSLASDTNRLDLVYQDEHLKSGAGVLIAMQFISSVIKLAGKENNFSLKFLNEEYYDFKGTDSYPFKGMSGHEIRNRVINQLAEQMYALLGSDTTSCPLSIETLPFNGLTHWRVLIIKCGDKQMSIYPNGGFINEWIFDKNTPYKTYDKNENLLIEDEMPLFRRKEIKYEVIIDSE